MLQVVLPEKLLVQLICIIGNIMSLSSFPISTERSQSTCHGIRIPDVRSDVVGHIYGMIGRDWTHQGVAKLFTDITNNGYQLLYLTSRSVGQADSTRGYLKSIVQGRYTIPEGPVIMSPDRTFTALRRYLTSVSHLWKGKLMGA